MMTGTITDDQARALAQLVALLSGDKRWDIAGVRAALSKARHKATAPELAIAAIRCATNPDAKTPAVIGMDGPHWVAMPFAGGRETRTAKCPTHGIAVRLVDGLCTGCVADTKAADDNRDDTLAIDPDQAATNARGAANARRQLDLHTARTTTKETATMRTTTCTFCDEDRDDLTIGSDGTTTACADCIAEGEATR